MRRPRKIGRTISVGMHHPESNPILSSFLGPRGTQYKHEAVGTGLDSSQCLVPSQHPSFLISWAIYVVHILVYTTITILLGLNQVHIHGLLLDAHAVIMTIMYSNNSCRDSDRDLSVRWYSSELVTSLQSLPMESSSTTISESPELTMGSWSGVLRNRMF